MQNKDVNENETDGEYGSEHKNEKRRTQVLL